MEYKLYATCPNELTDMLAEEIKTIGGKKVRTDYRVVYFTASEEVYYKAHLYLRTASRVFRIIKEIPAYSPTIIFDKVKRIKFGDYFSHDLPLKINVTVSNTPGKVEGHLIGSKIREAITDSFLHFEKKEAKVSSWDAPLTIVGYLNKNRLMLSIDTTFHSLHKRGHRVEGHPAPLKETLAAAMLQSIGYDGTTAFLDPMCGSGSIAIEAAQIAIHKAPLIHRKKGEFGFEYLKDFNSSLWRKVQEEARGKQIVPEVKIYASDIENKFVEIARSSALKARVEKYIDFQQADFFHLKKPADKGTLVVNIPYGMRLDEQEISKDFMKSIGDQLKKNFKGWTCGILVPEESPYKFIGLKTRSTLSFLNGMIKVKFLIFDIY